HAKHRSATNRRLRASIPLDRLFHRSSKSPPMPGRCLCTEPSIRRYLNARARNPMPEVYLTVIGEFPEKLLEMPVFSGRVWVTGRRGRFFSKRALHCSSRGRSSGVRPQPQKIVIAACDLDERGMVGRVAAKLL